MVVVTWNINFFSNGIISTQWLSPLGTATSSPMASSQPNGCHHLEQQLLRWSHLNPINKEQQLYNQPTSGSNT
jgi:hypothetical protein